MAQALIIRMSVTAVKKNKYKVIKFNEITDINNNIYEKYTRLTESEIKHKSHLFHGRYENIYIKEKALPEIEKIIIKIKNETAQYLNINEDELKIGFWFNAMHPGDQTSLHCHDDYDEILSGVYYIRVPKNSGNLILKMDDDVEIIPEEGMAILFSPALDHQVLINESKQVRLSIGFNVAVFDSEEI